MALASLEDTRERWHKTEGDKSHCPWRLEGSWEQGKWDNVCHSSSRAACLSAEVLSPSHWVDMVYDWSSQRVPQS